MLFQQLPLSCVIVFSYHCFISSQTIDTITEKNICHRTKLPYFLQNKLRTDKNLAQAVLRVTKSKVLSDVDKDTQLQTIHMFQREVNVTVLSLLKSVSNLQLLLKGDYRSINLLKHLSEIRLQQLKESMVEVEDEINVIADMEKFIAKKHTGKSRNNAIENFFKEMISGVAEAADVLEEKLDDNAFENELHSAQHKIAIETVVRLGGKSQEEDDEGIVMLVDSNSNHFVLSKPKDSTTTHIDHVLLKEIIYLILCAFLFTLLCALVKLPFIFACIITGVILGPSCINLITSIVQIETIGEFGVFFILFGVGIEFSPDKLKQVFRQSLLGTIGVTILLILIGLFWGYFFGLLPNQSIFITLCLSLTSTPMISNLLQGHTSKGHKDNGDFSGLLVSMLVLQDIILGVFMAILPILAGHTLKKTHSLANTAGSGVVHSWFHGAFGGPGEELFFTVFELSFALTGVAFITYVLSVYAAGKLLRNMECDATEQCDGTPANKTVLLLGSRESFVLCIVSGMFLLLLTTEYFGISMELGCYLCGTVVSSMGEKHVKQVEQITEPLQTFFSCLFFASIGFHVFPSFLMTEIMVFVPITLLVIATKFLVSAGVLHYLLPKEGKTKWLVAAGLAQLSEFSFVLGSRARRFGLISREVYLIILSVTTLSLLVSPFMWRLIYSIIMKTSPWKHNIKSILKMIRR